MSQTTDFSPKRRRLIAAALSTAGSACVLGSANLDNRSFRLNFEASLLTFDEGFNAQVAAMLEEADMLVLPSFAEGLPMVVMEAMRQTAMTNDRRVLDKQLQDTIYQFEHTDGVGGAG